MKNRLEEVLERQKVVVLDGALAIRWAIVGVAVAAAGWLNPAIAAVSARACSAVTTAQAARCIGFEPPPSRNDPALATPSMIARGATVQVMRQPG